MATDEVGGTQGTDVTGGTGVLGGTGSDAYGGAGHAEGVELVVLRDPAGLPRGSGFLADLAGTVITSHRAVAGLTQVFLHAPGPGGRTWLAGPADVTVLPGVGLALVRTDGLGVRPLPVALRGPVAPGAYVRLAARGWRQARVLGGAEVTCRAAGEAHEVPADLALELAIGTDGRDALRRGGEACGGPVLDATTGAVLAVVSTALKAEHRTGDFAVALHAAAAADPGGPLAVLLERNAATVPGHGADLNLAGALELTAATRGPALPPDGAGPGSEPVERPGIAAELDAFTAGDRPVLGLVGEPGTGRTTALAALAARRARREHPAPTLWLRGSDLRGGDGSLAAAVSRALSTASETLTNGPETSAAGPGTSAAGPGTSAAGSGISAAGSLTSAAGSRTSAAAVQFTGASPGFALLSDCAPAPAQAPAPPGPCSGPDPTGHGSGLGPDSGPEVRPGSGSGPGPGARLGVGSGSVLGLGSGFGSGFASGPGSRPGSGSGSGLGVGGGSGSALGFGPGLGSGSRTGPGLGVGAGGWAVLDPAGVPAAVAVPQQRAAASAGSVAAAPPLQDGVAERVARLCADAGRSLLIVLDAAEEAPPELSDPPGPWTAATAAWLRATGARMIVAARPEHWERAGALYPPGDLHVPARPARRLPPALLLGDLTPAEAGAARTRLGIPADAVHAADARHPLTLSLLSGIRAAGVTSGRPGRDEVFAAHLDLLCLRAAVRVAADGAGPAGVHGPGVRRLAARVAGRVHEAARRCLGPGRGQLDRASFEELFPWRTGWAAAVLAEGLLVPAGSGYRFGHEALSDWIQACHLDVPTALATLVRRPAGPGRPVPRHRIGPVLEALRRLPPQELHRTLMGLVHRLNGLAEDLPETPPATPPASAGPAAAGPTAGDSLRDQAWWAARLLRESLLRTPDALPYLPVLHALAEHVARTGPGEFGGWFWNRLRLPESDRLDLLRRLLPADPAEAVPGDRYLDAAARRLARDPKLAQPLLCAWFTDGRRLRGRPGATVAAAAQALLHTHRRLAPDDLTEALVAAAHPCADELLAALAEEESSALCRAVDRWAHDERPGRRVAAAVYGQAAAPHVRTPADRDLLRHAAQALLARPADAALHGSALAVLLRDPQVRGRYLPQALACFRDPGPADGPACGARLPAATLVAALPVLPDQDAVFAALRERADGEVVRALAALTTPGLARRAGDLVREHLARHPEDAPHAAAFVDLRLEQGPVAASVLRPLVLDLLRSAPVGVRSALAPVLAAPGGAASQPLRGELADVLLREESDPQVLDVFLGAVASGAGVRPPGRTRELLRRTGRQLMRAPGGLAVFERRTVELARRDPAFGSFVVRWMAEAATEAAALLGPSARRTVETLIPAAAAQDVT
ncbi:hypothetical protein ACFV0B_31205 [Streptomyces xanthophaeus]|uniref:hypothetical protein n=1 Tax=Streptomyces xanthophaeus TaxID=67385 RepID=UPI0036CEF050